MKITMLLMLAVASGCASERTASSGKATTRPDCAQCLVCKHNADLACVDVEVTPDTPRATYQGQVYYFCSTECRDEFQKHPEKYARR